MLLAVLLAMLFTVLLAVLLAMLLLKKQSLSAFRKGGATI